MRRLTQVLLVLFALVCFGIALSYPIRYRLAQESNNANMEELSALRESMLQASEEPTVQPTDTPAPSATPEPEATPELSETPEPETTPEPEATPETPAETPSPTASPSPTPDRFIRTDAPSYPEKEKKYFDEDQILPELRAIYRLNHDLAGWLSIPGTVINYPVVQSKDSDFYLKHDFYGEENQNGQIILDEQCDPYTPSYNLIISGHHMRNGSMFGSLTDYSEESFWQEHKLVEFDSLMERKQYIVFAAFYSADYDENEAGFRYSADIQYWLEAERWFEEIEENQLYDTGIDVVFGDEFLTLTTCSREHHKEGRFVAVCRRIREGETVE